MTRIFDAQRMFILVLTYVGLVPLLVSPGVLKAQTTASAQATRLTMDAYIRVPPHEASKTANLSPQLQQEKAKAWAASESITIGMIRVEEGPAVDQEPKSSAFRELMARVNSGKSDGLIIYGAQPTADNAPAMLVVKSAFFLPKDSGPPTEMRCYYLGGGEYLCQHKGHWYNCFRQPPRCYFMI